MTIVFQKKIDNQKYGNNSDKIADAKHTTPKCERAINCHCFPSHRVPTSLTQANREVQLLFFNFLFFYNSSELSKIITQVKRDM